MTGIGLAGRRTAQLILLLTVGLDALPVLLVMTAPNTMGGSTMDGPSPLGLGIVGIGVALNVVGLVWMVRIIRADPEAHVSSWRAVRRR